MGRIKTMLVKRTVKKLMDENRGMFKPDFEHNKQQVKTILDIPSKKLRNIVAGYVTKLAKKEGNEALAKK